MTAVPKVTADMVRDAAEGGGQVAPLRVGGKKTGFTAPGAAAAAQALRKTKAGGQPTAAIRKAIRDALDSEIPQDELVQLLAASVRSGEKWSTELWLAYRYGRPAMTVFSASANVTADEMGGLFRALVGAQDEAPAQIIEGQVRVLPEGNEGEGDGNLSICNEDN